MPRFKEMRSSRRSFVLLGLLACASLWAFLPTAALAQSYAFPSEPALNSIIDYYYRFGRVLNGKLRPWAARIFTLAATIQAALILWNIILEEVARRQYSAGGVRGLLRKLLSFLLFIFLTGAILTNNATITNSFESYFLNDIAPWVLNEACYAPNGSQSLSPSTVVKMGWWVFYQSRDNMYLATSSGQLADSTAADSVGQTEDGIFSYVIPSGVKENINSLIGSAKYALGIITSIPRLLTFIATLLLIPSYYVIAFQVIIAELSLALIKAFIPVFLAFLPLSFASTVVSGYVRYYLYTVFKLFFIYLLLVPVLKLPSVILASMTTNSSTTVSSPIGNCTNTLIDNPDGFTAPDQSGEAKTQTSRYDVALTFAAFALASVSLLKTIPERLASYVTSGFSLRFLYQIYE